MGAGSGPGTHWAGQRRRSPAAAGSPRTAPHQRGRTRPLRATLPWGRGAQSWHRGPAPCPGRGGSGGGPYLAQRSSRRASGAWASRRQPWIRSRASARCSSTGVSEAASKGTTSSGRGTSPWGRDSESPRTPTDTPGGGRGPGSFPYLQAGLELRGQPCPQLLQLGRAGRLRGEGCGRPQLLLPPHAFALGGGREREVRRGHPPLPCPLGYSLSPPAPRAPCGRGRSAPACAGRGAPSPPGPARRRAAAWSHQTCGTARGGARGTPSGRRCCLENSRGGGCGISGCWGGGAAALGLAGQTDSLLMTWLLSRTAGSGERSISCTVRSSSW